MILPSKYNRQISVNHRRCFSGHPRTKGDVGYRLSRSGLAIAYGQQIEFQGPIVSNASYTNGSDKVILTYTAVSAIELRNSIGFEVRKFDDIFFVHLKTFFLYTGLLSGDSMSRRSSLGTCHDY